MERVVIWGAGGHGREIAEIVRHQNQVAPPRELLGFIDDNPARQGELLDGVPILGGANWFEHADCAGLAVICAVGSPKTVKLLVERLDAWDIPIGSAISPLAYIASSAKIGPGVCIFPHVVVNVAAVIEGFCTLNTGVSVSHDSVVARYCNLNPGARLAGAVTLGEGCFIGMSASVIQGKSIGGWSVIGAGTVVLQDLPSHVTAVGVPARIVHSNADTKQPL